MPERRIKCLVWDLDQTLWSGILLEGDQVALQPGVRETILELDGRGILQSIASQNDPALAIGQLTTSGLADYFLHPQISLTADKPAQVAHVAHLLNLQLEHVAFIDDDPSQRAYVLYTLPAVTVLEANQAPILPQMSMFAVDRLTEEARHRRSFIRPRYSDRRLNAVGMAGGWTFCSTVTQCLSSVQPLRRTFRALQN